MTTQALSGETVSMESQMVLDMLIAQTYSLRKSRSRSQLPIVILLIQPFSHYYMRVWRDLKKDHIEVRLRNARSEASKDRHPWTWPTFMAIVIASKKKMARWHHLESVVKHLITSLVLPNITTSHMIEHYQDQVTISLAISNLRQIWNIACVHRPKKSVSRFSLTPFPNVGNDIEAINYLN